MCRWIFCWCCCSRTFLPRDLMRPPGAARPKYSGLMVTGYLLLSPRTSTEALRGQRCASCSMFVRSVSHRFSGARVSRHAPFAAPTYGARHYLLFPLVGGLVLYFTAVCAYRWYVYQAALVLRCVPVCSRRSTWRENAQTPVPVAVHYRGG